MAFPETIKAIAIDEEGGIDVLQVKDVPFPAVAPGNIVVKVVYGGVNFIDTYYRKGLYPIKSYPQVLGMEASGTIVALPTDESVLTNDEYKKRAFQIGTKVAVNTLGTHAQYASVPWSKVFPIPANVSLLTALSFLEESYRVKPGDTVLIHTVAGGFGLIAAQLAKRAGATVIGTTSTEEKAAIAREHGADHVILYTKENVVERVLQHTAREGVHAVYDGVGKDTFLDNFKLLRRKGTLVSVGNASGAVEPIAPLKLVERNLALLRPTMANYIYTPEEARYYGDKLFEYVSRGELKTIIHKEYPFTTEGARQAQTDLTTKGGSTVGKLIYKIADE